MGNPFKVNFIQLQKTNGAPSVVSCEMSTVPLTPVLTGAQCVRVSAVTAWAFGVFLVCTQTPVAHRPLLPPWKGMASNSALQPPLHLPLFPCGDSFWVTSVGRSALPSYGHLFSPVARNVFLQPVSTSVDRCQIMYEVKSPSMHHHRLISDHVPRHFCEDHPHQKVLVLQHVPSDDAGVKHLSGAVLYQSNVHFLHVPKHIFSAKYSVFRGRDVVG